MKHILQLTPLLILLVLVSPLSHAQLPGAGSAYNFSNNHMTTPEDPSLNPSYISIEAWIKADTWATNVWENVIVSKDGWASGNEGYVLRAGANGTLSFNFSGAGTWIEATSTPVMQTGKWYHVAGTYDGSVMRIYINGQQVGSANYTGVIDNGTYDLHIGRAAYTIGGTRYFDGVIDEVRMWNTAISQTAIQDYMCKKLDPSHPHYASLIAHYPFDNPNPLMDSSPNGHNLTNVGATHVTSGAAIGDVSVHQYGGPYNLSLAYSNVDSIHVQSANSMSTIHLYRVDTAPNTLNASSSIDSMDYSHYYGVYVGATASYNYTMAYNYYGSPMGLTNASNLNLAGRTDATVPSWSPQGATVNQVATTVNKTFNNRSEVMLAIACKQLNLSTSGVHNLCGNETLTVTDQATNINYQWHNSNGPIPSETNASYTITTTGDYYLTANEGMCVDTSSMINVTINPIPTVDFGTLGNTFCQNDVSTPILNPTPAGGTYSGPGISGTNFNPSMTAVGTHTLYYDYTDGNGCSNVDSMEVDVYPQPATPVISVSGDLLCVNSNGTGSIYEWALNGTTVATGTDTCYTALANGSYTVTCTSPEGCSSNTSTPQTIAGIGIEEIHLDAIVSVSPNPTKESVTVQFDALNTQLNISLRDIHGRLLERKTGTTQVEFNLGGYDNGIYLIESVINGHRIVKRIIKE